MLKRSITTIILAPLTILSIYKLNDFYFAILVAVIIALACWEYSSFIDLKKNISRYLFVFINMVILAVCYLNLSMVKLVLPFVCIWWLINILHIYNFPKHTKFWNGNLIIKITNAILVLVPTWIAIVMIRQDFGDGFLLFLIFLIWGCDIGAYFSGKNFGKTPLATNVSPNKTWEGVAGAFIFSIIVSLLIMYFNEFPLNTWLTYLTLTTIVMQISIVGDLFESMYKRLAKIDDSGSILPGHGGIMDRIDSLTSAAPFFYIGCTFLST